MRSGRPGCHECWAWPIAEAAGKTYPSAPHPCRSSTRRTFSCCAAITSAPRSTGFTVFMTSASGAITSGSGRPSQTASTACRWRRWWMKRYLATACPGVCDTRPLLPLKLAFTHAQARQASADPPATVQPYLPACSIGPESTCLLAHLPAYVPCPCSANRSCACTAAFLRSSSRLSRSSESRGQPMSRILGCCATCSGQIQTRTCRHVAGWPAVRVVVWFWLEQGQHRMCPTCASSHVKPAAR